MLRRFVQCFLGLILMCFLPPAAEGIPSPTNWWGTIGPLEWAGGFSFGTRPGCEDGYDGQAAVDLTKVGVHLRLFRATGPGWSGPTGFYREDYESLITPGGSKTWWGIRLWSHNYTPEMGDRVRTTYYPEQGGSPPDWWAKLVLEYAPSHLNWTGETEWWFPLQFIGGYYPVPPLPVPITDDPWNPDNVTRLHLEVYTYPIPEPSSLAALGFALAGVGIGVVRRRRS